VIRGTPNLDSGKPTLTINVTADNTVSITDGKTSRGSYSVTGDLILNMSNRNDTVVITLSGGSLNGGISASLLNGNDSLTVRSIDAERTISGGISVNGGNGNDFFVLASGNPGGLKVEGAVSFNGGAGKDIAFINHTTDEAGTTNATGPLLIGAGLTLTRVNGDTTRHVNIGTKATVEISGNLIINASADKLVTNRFVIGSDTKAVSIAGTLAITGGQGADNVEIQNTTIVDVIPAEDEVLEITINLDRGVNNTKLTAIDFGTSGTDADFAYTGGTGEDIIEFEGTNTVSGDAIFNFGNGQNILELSSSTTFDADVTVTGGKNNDTVVIQDATISGLLTLTMGNGVNNFTTTDKAGIAGGLTYTGGSEADTVRLENGDGLAGDVSISVGAGGDTIEITGTTTVGVTSLTVDLGIDSAVDSFKYNLILESLITILNQGSEDTVTSE